MRLITITLLSLLLMACSARQCEFEGEYLQAREYPDLKNPGNGELPARDPAYMIPPVPEQEYKAARMYTNAAGEEKIDCIDRPPRLIAPPAS